MKSHMDYQLAYLDLTLVNSKDQGHAHAHFDCEYLKMVTDVTFITIASKYDVACGLSISIFKVDLGVF